MYAVIKTGGKQYRVKEGDIIRIEKIDGEVGQSIELGEVLLIADPKEPKIGQPVVNNAKVVGDIIRQGKGKKIIIFKSKRRKGYRKKQGHRQNYTFVRINKIIG